MARPSFLVRTTGRHAVESNQDIQKLIIEGQILFSLPANARRLDDTLLPDEWYIRSLVLEMGAHLGMVSGYQGGYLASGIPAVIGQAKFGQLPVTLVRDPGEEETMNLEKGAPRPSIIDEKNGSMPALPVTPGKAGRNGSRAFSFASQ